jgi:hypothetical protein
LGSWASQFVVTEEARRNSPLGSRAWATSRLLEPWDRRGRLGRRAKGLVDESQGDLARLNKR